MTTTLTLDLPAWLENLQGGVMQGDGTASLTINPHQLSWSFSGAEALQSVRDRHDHDHRTHVDYGLRFR